MVVPSVMIRPTPASAADLKRTCVLAYSWNKADLLETTLDHVAESDTGGALVAVLHTAKKGRIIIEYQGNEDLQRLLEKLGVET